MQYIKLVHSKEQHNDWFVVNWCLGNTCNFSCSYCPKSLHDASIAWPDPNVVKNFIQSVKNHYSDKKIYFEFTGGEVTMYRHFAEICKFCASLGIKVGLISNGSRTLRYWEENKEYFDHVCLSYHPEFTDEKHFLQVINVLHNDVRTHVNIMMSPTKFEQCCELADKVKDLGNLSLALQPLIHDFGDKLYDYTAEQKEILDKQHEIYTKHIKFTKSFDYYRGAMKAIYPDNTTKITSAHRFINEGTNNWSGWNCWAGVEQLIVDMDGHYYRGWCKVGGRLGKIDVLPLHFPTTPVLCNKTMCHCNFDIMSTKEKVQ